MTARRGGRVLVVVDGLGNGGAERQVALLVEHLPPEWERRVWSMAGGPFAGVIRSAGVSLRVRERVSRRDVRPAFDLWREIVQWRPDVVHSWGWMCTAAAGPVCRLLAIPVIDGTIRMGMVPPYHGRAARLSMRWATRVIANSHAGLEAYGIGRARGRVVHNGFDPRRLSHCTPMAGAGVGVAGEVTSDMGAAEAYTPAPDAGERRVGRACGFVSARAESPYPPAPGVDDRPFTAVMTGRMVPAKDYRTFVAAARALATDRAGSWRFAAVGDGPARAALMREAGALVDGGVIQFARPGLEVLGVVRQAHAGVLMSHPALHAEGCSNAIMEYMACGLPVVCSESGGNRELVVDGKTGFIIPSCDVTALVERLTWLRDHPARAWAMGERGRARIMNEYSAAVMAAGMVAVYRDAIHHR